MQPNTLLELQNLQISFKNADKQWVKSLKGVDLQVHKSEVLGIIGESGSGKSITFLTLLRLLPANSLVEGKILFSPNQQEPMDLLTIDIASIRKLALKHIAYIFQDPLAALNPSLKIGKQLMEAVLDESDKTNRKKKCLEILEEVMPNMAERAFESYPHQLSGGQRQRVMIAMALLNKPDLLIADEPTTALDPEVQVNILNLLTNLVRKNNSSLVLISHDIRSVADYCDRIAVFYQGNLVEIGKTSDIVNNPKEAYTKALLNCRPNSKNLGYFLPTIKDFMENEFPKTEHFSEITVGEENLLEGTNISRVYNKTFKALEPLSFHIKKGECVGIIGQSGSGKSTLAKILVKLEKSDTGHLLLNSDIKQSHVQMVFQDPFSSLNPAIRIGEAIEEVLKIHQPHLSSKDRNQKAKELLEETGIDGNLMDKKPASFSGGQRQRICIARALAAQPEILVCDEAVSALDISVQAQVINLLKKLQIEKGLSLVFITHDMNVARHICNRILVLKDGQLVEEANTNELFEHPKHPYSQKLISYYQE